MKDFLLVGAICGLFVHAILLSSRIHVLENEINKQVLQATLDNTTCGTYEFNRLVDE